MVPTKMVAIAVSETSVRNDAGFSHLNNIKLLNDNDVECTYMGRNEATGCARLDRVSAM